MIISSKKMYVVGTLSTLVGRYSLLSLQPSRTDLPRYLRESKALSFYVVDDEGFANNIFVNGDFVIVPSVVPTMVDVRVVPIEMEVLSPDIVTADTIEL